MALTLKEQLQLKKLLIKMRTESDPPSDFQPTGRPAGLVPSECLEAFFKATCTPFMEVVICRPRGDGYEFLYEDRHDEHWNGFCAHGGAIRAGFPESPVDIAQRIIDREFQGYDLTVTTVQVVAAVNWQMHPWANPFAVVCLVSVDKGVPETGGRRWLSADALPDDPFIYNHRRYLEQCIEFLRNGALVFTPQKLHGI